LAGDVRWGYGAPAMLTLHDAVLVDHVLWATALVGLVAVALVRWRRLGLRRIALSVLTGAVLCLASLGALSTGYSGTVLRTRYGLPHHYAVSQVDPETGRSVGRFQVDPGYLIADCAFWMALALVAGAAGPTRRAGGAKRPSTG
jgi:hypothetical protein